jgi:cysteinyl-tRNA synthetase
MFRSRFCHHENEEADENSKTYLMKAWTHWTGPGFATTKMKKQMKTQKLT